MLPLIVFSILLTTINPVPIGGAEDSIKVNTASRSIRTSYVDKLHEVIKVFLPKCVKDKTCKMIADTIRTGSRRYGFLPRNHNTILALIKQESDGRHGPGRGEWGMLQVVPWESHIMRMTQYYKCIKGDKLCRCPRRGSCRTKVPMVTKVGQRGTKPNRWLVRNFLKANARAALFIGIGEMAFWRDKYDRNLKYKFWGRWRNKRNRGAGPRFPKRYIKARLWDLFKESGDAKKARFYKTERWWYQVTKSLGKDMWIVHHNYGYQIRFDKIGMAYPLQYARNLKRIARIEKKLGL